MDNTMRLNKKVLVVEDDDSSQYLVQITLEEMGLSVTIVSDGKAAVDKLRTEAFDLVLMDIRLPGVSGYDATRSIREELKLDVPIIAVSAHAMEWVPEKCAKAGMNGFVSKPVDAAILKALILKHVQG